MISLAYYSTASSPMSAAELGGIVEAAQRNNAANDITGMLCHYDGSFLQFLEGPEDAVSRTFDRIKRDSRHRQILEVDRRPIAGRAFGEWSMAAVKLDEMSPAQQAFCRSLRDVEITADAAHRSTIDGFLQAFKSWLR